MSNAWAKYLTYVSLAFLAVALARAGYLRVPEIRHAPALLVSFPLLFAGFVARGVAWAATLQRAGLAVSYREGVTAFGISVFAKYIPGKIAMIVGPAAQIAARHEQPLVRLASLSLQAQLLAIWVGLVLGALGLHLLGRFELYGSVLVVGWLTLGVVIFFEQPHRVAARFLSRILRRSIDLPKLRLAAVLRLLPWFVLTWIFYSAGFYFLVAALTERDFPLATGLGFALAVTLGIVAMVAPGGLGVREGILIAYLVACGFGTADATTISITSRLWFLLGEAFVFLVGIAGGGLRDPPKPSSC